METGILHGGLITGNDRKMDLTRRKSLVDFDGVFLCEGCCRETWGLVGDWSGATALAAGGGGGGGRLGVEGLCLGVGILVFGEDGKLLVRAIICVGNAMFVVGV